MGEKWDLLRFGPKFWNILGKKLGENLGKWGKNGRKSDGNEMKIGGEIWGEMGKNW